MSFRPNVAHAALVLLAFAALHFLFFGVALLEGRLLAPGDAFIQSLPAYLSSLKGWTPLVFSGYPIQADPQAMAWYPPALLLSQIPGSWNVFVLLAYVMSGAFCYGYVHCITQSRLAGAIAGTVFSLSGFLIAHLGHTNMIHSVAWVPLMIWSLEEIWRGGGRIWGLIGSLATANSFLAGHPQLFAYGLLLVAVYWLSLEWEHRGVAKRVPRTITALYFGLGIGMGGILLIPMLELAGESIRVELTYKYFVSGSLRLLELPQLFFPHIWGGWQVPLFGEAPMNFFARGNHSETRVFVGVLPLMLAGVVMLSRSKPAKSRFWIAVAVVALLFALGRQIHVIAPLYLVPGLNRFRIPARHLMEFQLAISILSGMGIALLAKLEREVARELFRRSAIGVAGLAAISLLLFVAALYSGSWENVRIAAGVQLANAWPWSNPTVILQLFAAFCGAACLWYWLQARSVLAAALLCVVLVLDLGTHGWISTWRVSPRAANAAEIPAGLKSLREELKRTGQRVLTLGTASPDLSAPPNRNLIWDIANASGYGPLVLKRYSEFAEIGPYGVDDLAILSETDRALDLLAVRYLMVPERYSDEARPYLEESARWRLVAQAGGVSRYENLRAQPRAWLVASLQPATDDDMLAAIRGTLPLTHASFDPARAAFVERMPPEHAEGDVARGRVEIVSLGPERSRFRIRADEPSFLVVSDVFYPGWKGRVNGISVDLYRTNYVLRGLSVPAGESEVELSFESRSSAFGAALSAGSFAVALISLARFPASLRRKRVGAAM